MSTIITDKISIERIKTLHPKLRGEVTTIVENIYKRGVPVRVVYGIRTFAEQELLYSQGRTRPGGIVTNAKPGLSYHQYGLAIDLCLLTEGGKNVSWDIKVDNDKDKTPDWMEMVEEFKKFGWIWGGDFKSIKDYPHFEKSFGLKVSDCLKLYQEKKQDKEGYIIF